MGKTKTAFVASTEEVEKTSAEKYAEKKMKKAALMVKDQPKKEESVEPTIADEIKVEESHFAPSTSLRASRDAVERVRGRKYLEAKAKINKANSYRIIDAVKLVKETSYSKFDGTMEMHLVVKKTGVNVNVTLPNATGKQKKIEVATESTLEKLKTGKIDFDILLATADMMPKLVAFAKLLGPKGLMPNPKNGTIIKSVKDKEKFGGNSINLKTEKEAPLIHTSFGKVSQKDEELIKNAEMIIEKLGGNKTIVRAFVKSTMSPSVKIVI